MYKLFLLAIVLAVFTTKTFAQASANAIASATIVAPIGITQVEDMNFGNIAVSGTIGTVVLGTDGNRSLTGGVTLPATAGTVSAAEFTVTGEGSYTYDITLPSSHIITRQSGSETMTIDQFVSSPSGSGTLSSGSETLLIGATINVGANQVAGTYTNATGFEVTVNYN